MTNDKSIELKRPKIVASFILKDLEEGELQQNGKMYYSCYIQ